MAVNTDLTGVLLPKYANKWVALNPDETEVIAVGESPGDVLEQAKEKGVQEPVVTFVVKDYGFLVP